VREFFSNFHCALTSRALLRLLAAATAMGENQQSTTKSSNQPVCVKRERMKESEDAGENKQPTNLEGRKQNSRTTINNQQSSSWCHAHVVESKNNNQPAAAVGPYNLGPQGHTT